ncbi:AAA family ATPase [Deinococcus cellulosilyticus]|uniref:AAA+ ATPase domain-containing protein n=1 Tax=Deinococcus cellulosilyticus (strain DSM 18568 / NBRC 106333 / KACC 11606 / 5516J-15) TaxID=1223518 RepID=A0A511MVU8_DEIC1|nr:AAA family ATPase [Deinococcus cellulosilyticus]GEM44709.1 hypothetical protein DC3_03440 [Deinococcus cellulosilyticus NBRC 106333 = KACC 11606]
MPGYEETAYLRKLHLKNIRLFKDLQLDFVHEGAPRMRTLIIGQNGTGKTTLLRTIALAYADVREARLLVDLHNGHFTGSGGLGQITAETFRGTSITFNLEREKNHDLIRAGYGMSFDRERPGEFVVGYGVSRSSSEKSSRTSSQYEVSGATRTLFEAGSGLADPELTLRRIQDFYGKQKYTSFMTGIQKALGLPRGAKLVINKGGGVFIEQPRGEKIPLEGWADGYRLTFQWVIDVYAWALNHEKFDHSQEISGLLLIDEIEQHLHPRLQYSLMQNLSVLFPKMQIIATTHSPIVTLGVDPSEVVVLKHISPSEVTVAEAPDYRLSTLEDLVESEQMFDTEIYSSHLKAISDEYDDLVSKSEKQRTPQDLHRMNLLATQMQSEDPDDLILKELRKLEQTLRQERKND